MEKMAWDGPKWGREGLFPVNPDLADILGRTDLDFQNFHFSICLDPKFLDFQVPRFPKSGLCQAGLGPWAGCRVDFLEAGKSRFLEVGKSRFGDLGIQKFGVQKIKK